jgi:hypothetical protein
MSQEENKYEQILKILRKSGPTLADPESLTEKILDRLRREKSTLTITDKIKEYFFGWVYIGWARRALITASILIILIFAYQQTLILSRISSLERKEILTENADLTDIDNSLKGKLFLYKITGRKIPVKNITLSEKQAEQIIDSFNELQSKYSDLVKLIEEDPELKEYIENKLAEKKVKSKL